MTAAEMLLGLAILYAVAVLIWQFRQGEGDDTGSN
jgi:hypothetical protein